MADLLRELVSWIAAQTGLQIGTTLFAGTIPPGQHDEAAVVIPRTGPAEWRTAGIARVGEPLVQVLVRGPTFYKAHDLAHRIHAALHGAVGIPLGDHVLLAAEATSEPGYLGPDDEKPPRHVFSTNYQIRKYTGA